MTEDQDLERAMATSFNGMRRTWEALPRHSTGGATGRALGVAAFLVWVAEQSNDEQDAAFHWLIEAANEMRACLAGASVTTMFKKR